MKETLEDKILTDNLKPQVYTGIGGRKLSEEKERLPAAEVKNEVIWVNKNMDLPFNIEEGESNRLGMFFNPPTGKEDDSFYHLEVMPLHHRSGILGRVIFKDKEGRLYRDVDLKGVGFTDLAISKGMIDEIRVMEPSLGKDPAYPDEKKALGILDKSFAENDIKMSENFLKSGIRTYRPIAMIELQEIIDGKGNKISLEEAENRKLIKEGDEPVVEVRAFGTRARIDDLFDGFPVYIKTPITTRLLEDAIKLVAQERGIDPDNFSGKEYLNWFAETLAVSVARMHNKNWIHGYLTPHNITLDARIIDLDSVETSAEINKRKKAGENTHKSYDHDVVGSKKALAYLATVLEINRSNISRIFNEAYKEERRVSNIKD